MKRTCLALAVAGGLGCGGCTVAWDKFDQPIVAIPLTGAEAVTTNQKVGAVAQAASPFLDLLVPGLGVAATGVLGGLGYGVRRGHRTATETSKEKIASFNEGAKRNAEGSNV